MKKDRAILNFLSSKPWAITPEALETVHEVVLNHLQGLPISMKGDASENSSYTCEYGDQNVSVIRIHGTIAKKLYGMQAISGGRTTVDYKNEIQEALSNPEISGIVLDIDSPGGTVDGTKELADFIFESRGQKPIIAYANGQMCSAAYWIGSAADHIVAYDTSQIGSIGVIISHHDYSKAEEQAGVKTTHIYAGKYKALGSPHEPLSESGKAYLQESVDYYYTIFVDSVAQHRGVGSNVVLETMAEGRVFIGNQAKEVQLVDVLGSLDVAINLAKEGGKKVTLKEMIEKHGASAVLAELVNHCSAELPTGVVEAFTAANTPRVTLPPELQAQIDAMQSKIDLLESEKQEAQKKLEEEQAATAQKELRASIEQKLTTAKLEVDEKLVALGMTMEADQFDYIVGKLALAKGVVSEVTRELFTETPNASSEQGKDQPELKNFDTAVIHVMNRDKIDIEAAIKVAVEEFKPLYDAHISVKGGN